MTRFILFLLLIFQSISNSFANNKFSLQQDAYVNAHNSLPFWLHHNQTGKIQGNSSFHSISQLTYAGNISIHKKIVLTGGINTVFELSDKSYFQLNNLYGRAQIYFAKLEAGRFHEDTLLNGLSSTNGEMYRSQNSLPYPKVRISTNDFISVPFIRNHFKVKLEYDEGFFTGNRVVSSPKIHHKSAYLKWTTFDSFNFTAGLNHYVFWGGYSERVGQMPESFSAYLRYITARIGNAEFPLTDQLNVVGNQLGSFNFKFDFYSSQANYSFYINHPFEDKSGIEMDNIRDNLYGLYIDLKQSPFIDAILYEYMYTKHQSGHIHKIGFMRGRDNYFNHGVYQSGFTNKKYMMGSPFFGPVIVKEGISKGIENTRIVMHHLGLNGNIGKTAKWKLLCSYSINYGMYHIPYEPKRNQLSTLLEIKYQKNLPFQIKAKLAYDHGDLYNNNLGFMLGLKKTW